MIDPQSLLAGTGVFLTLAIIAGIIFAESGLLIGFFLPGDTLLLTAGILAAQGTLPLIPTIVIIAVAAISGDNLGYHIGKKLGPRLFRKKDGILFRHEYVERSQAFFERFGIKTMLFAHYVPVVRSFAPLVAGVGHMDRRKFVIFDAIGNISWAVIVTLIGYWFGSKLPKDTLDHYIVLAIGGVMLLTVGPMLWHLLVNKRFWKAVGTKIGIKRLSDIHIEK
jgi:membrane-associated protein